jgi:signal transduction histidine kinase
VEIGISVSTTGILLEVRDDGRGVPVEGAPSRLELDGHMGLAGMRERISALGGTVRFQGAPGAGASLEVLVPAGPTGAG